MCAHQGEGKCPFLPHAIDEHTVLIRTNEGQEIKFPVICYSGFTG